MNSKEAFFLFFFYMVDSGENWVALWRRLLSLIIILVAPILKSKSVSSGWAGAKIKRTFSYTVISIYSSSQANLKFHSRHFLSIPLSVPCHSDSWKQSSVFSGGKRAFNKRRKERERKAKLKAQRPNKSEFFFAGFFKAYANKFYFHLEFFFFFRVFKNNFEFFLLKKKKISIKIIKISILMQPELRINK